MPPTIILVRHAEALHNDYSIPDPDLSELGLQQCKELREHFAKTLPGKLDVELVVVSPMRRTLKTALLTLDWLMEKGVPLVADAGWQETTLHACDVGSPVVGLKEEFPQVDFSTVDPVFPDKTSPQASRYAYTREALVRRGQAGLRALHARPEKVIMVVSHSGFMTRAVSGCMFANADYRVFEIEELEGIGEEGDGEGAEKLLQLREWEETRRAHGGMGWSRDEILRIGDGIPV